MASSDVTIIPPSPQAPRFLLGKNEYPVTHPSSPAIRHSPSILRRAPIDCAASSITLIPFRDAIAMISSMSAICP